MNTSTGLYIGVDGPDGIGKSGFVNLAETKLKSILPSVALIREPEHDGPLWPAIRDHRLSGYYPNEVWASVLAAASLGAQARRGGIVDQLLLGTSVIADRTLLTCLALYMRKVDHRALSLLPRGFRAPDLLLLLQPIGPELLLKRMRARGQSEVDIAEDMSVWQNYREAGDLLVEKGWNVRHILVDEGDTAEKLWEKSKLHLLPLLNRSPI